MAQVLVVGPHPDDQEIGMGGTIALLAAQGHDVLLLDMTNGEPTPFGDPETRAKEAEAAAAILAPTGGEGRVGGGVGGGVGGRVGGGGRVTRHLLGLPNRYVEHTIEARHMVAGVIRAHQAQIVFCPYPEDAHPDHRAVTRIVEDARFDAKLTKLAMPGDQGRDPIYPKWLFYYYASHLRWVADPSFIVDVTGYESRKIDAIRAYHTQFVLPEKNRAVVDWVAAAGTYFGSRIGTRAGEPFHTKEPIGLGSLAGVVGVG